MSRNLPEFWYRLILTALFAGFTGDLCAVAMLPLRQNGAEFIIRDKRFLLHSLDRPDLLALSSGNASKVLARASAAGFNAVSFDAPLFGPQGLVGTRGKIQPKILRRLKRLLVLAEQEKIYLFPVLWNPQSVQALVKAVGGNQRYFWAYKRHMQWQAWLLEQLAVKAGFAGNNSVGGLLLYRGGWPGPYPDGAVTTKKKKMHFVKVLAKWSAWQVRVANKTGLVQPKGLGFWFVEDLPLERKSLDYDEGDLRVDGDASAPLPELLGEGEQPALIDTSQLDILPPVPGEEKIVDKEGKPVYAAASTQIEWNAFVEAYRGIPLGSWLDFMEVTFDTGDWHRVARKFSGVSRDELEVPLLWRHDWRVSSGYERGKRLDAKGLAGLSGPWPQNAWPKNYERIWPRPVMDPASAKNRALAFKELSLKKSGGEWELTCRMNRPAVVKVSWGGGLPLENKAARMDKALIHRLKLKGVRQGDKLMLTVRADSDRWGRAVVRTRWIQVTDSSKRKK